MTGKLTGVGQFEFGYAPRYMSQWLLWFTGSIESGSVLIHYTFGENARVLFQIDPLP